MASTLEFRADPQDVRRRARARVVRPGDGAGRVRQPARAVGLRQDDGPAHRRRVRAPRLRRRARRRPRRARRAGRTSATWAWCSRATACSPTSTSRGNVAFGLRVRRVSKAEQQRRVGEALERVHLVAFAQPLPAPALRRPTAASGPGPGARVRAGRAAARRAAVGPRRQGARQPARGDPPVAAAARHDHAVRHPRPGGGAVDLRPHGRDVERAARTARHAT